MTTTSQTRTQGGARQRRSWWRSGALRVLISVALLAWLGSSVEWREVGALAAHLHYEWIILALILHAANRCLTAWKWRILLKAKRLSFPYLYLLRVVWISNFFGHFMPAALGGDSVRMLTMARRSHRPPEVVSSVLMERLTGVMSLAALAVVGGLWSLLRWGRRDVLIAITLPLGALLAVLALLWTPPGNRLLDWMLGRMRRLPGHAFLTEVHKALHAYHKHPRAVVASLAVSTLLQLYRVLIVDSVARTVGVVLSPGEALALVPALYFISMLPISVAGWGVQEGAYVVLLRLAGVGTAVAFGMSIMTRLIAMASNLPGAILFLAQGIGRRAGAGSRQAAHANGGPVNVLWVIDHVCYDGSLHGGGRLYWNLLPQFDPAHVRVVPCLLRANETIRQVFARSPMPVRILNKGRFDPTTLLTLVRLIRRERIQVLHLHCYGSSTFGRLASLLTGVPAVIHDYDTEVYFPYPAYLGVADRLLAPVARYAIAASPMVRDFQVRKRHIAPARVRTMFHAIPPERFAAPPAARVRQIRQTLGAGSGTRVVGTVTKLGPQRGNDVLVEVAQGVLASAPDTLFVVLYKPTRLHRTPDKRYVPVTPEDTGRQVEALQRQAARLGVSERVRFVECPEAFDDWIAACDVIAAPFLSPRFSSVTLLEAMAAGRPVIATDLGEPREFVVNGVNGYLVKPGDPGAMAQRIVDAVSRPAEWERLSRGAQATSAQHSTETYARMLEQLYAGLAGNGHWDAPAEGAPS